MSKIIQKRVIVWFTAIIMSILVSGCGGGGGSGGAPILGQGANIAAPAVVAVTPANNDTNVSYTIKNITAEFSIPMDLATLTTTSFTLVDNNNISAPVSGVTYANKVANLALSADLLVNTVYTATISTNAKSTDGIALLNNYVWTFTTGSIPDTIPPEVTSTSPTNGATNVPITKLITATFSEAMMASSITATTPATFSVKKTGSSVNIAGAVTYSVINKIVAFKPTLDLDISTSYTATITTVAKDLAGNQMLNDYNWTFITAATAIIPPPLVDFGSAKTFAIASTEGVTNLGATTIDGDVVLNPTYTCNGAALTADGTFTGCAGDAPTLVSPYKVISPIYQPTITAQSITDDLRVAYLSITPANMPGGTLITAPTTLGSGSTGQNIFAPGVYTTGSSSSIGITGDLTLNGGPNDTFVFQSWSTIDMAVGARIILTGGAKASNVYWLAGSSATLLGNSVWNGNLLAYASISMGTGATSCGRLFAGASTAGAFTFLANTVAVPGNTVALPGCE